MSTLAKKLNLATDRIAADRLALPLDIEAGQWPHLFRTILVALSTTVFILVGLAAIAPVREIAVAEGQIVPQGSVVSVSHLEGGIVAEILARQGQIVEAGTPILRLQPIAATADFSQLDARRSALAATRERLLALLDEREPLFAFQPGDAGADAVREQQALFVQDRDALVKARATIEARVGQRSAEVAAAEAEMQSLDTQIATNSERVTTRGALLKQGYASRNAYLDAQLQLEQTRARVAQVTGQIRGGRSALAEAHGQAAEVVASKRVQWSTELAKTSAELAETEQMLAKQKDRVDRLYVRAPVGGMIHELIPKSVGTVLKPGDVAVALVPVSDTMIAEVRTRPEDIGYVRAGLPAKIKLTAFDAELFGAIDATVKSVSPTTFKTEKGDSFYRVELTLSRTELTGGGQHHDVIPGMVVRAEIVTGEKSVLHYLLKPIYRSFDLAFTER